ncbi:hypothetical protein BDV26DRAFT_298272 [Aspergillus bertholletiae]|uniref:Major facilitator superfamily (MFS) profile domain-containing protein n=1 Tax=Aspergillus bertholletiae TaxID=1226010 RepID=A0A5N7AQJ0_9EURO|nr:hypothetical protein BDV26DRAFT_298272 [Aspergillus bertholletiae]
MFPYISDELHADAVALFVLGSGIRWGAIINPAMMIIGGTIQRIGNGGINVMIDMIISNLLPLREGGMFLGMTFIMSSIGTSLGSFIGSALVSTHSVAATD